MKWECACGFNNLISSLECEACGWSRDYSDRYKNGSLPKITDEEQRRRDKIILRKEIKYCLYVIAINIFAIKLTYSEEYIDYFIIVVYISLFIIPTCIIIIAILWLRARKLK